VTVPDAIRQALVEAGREALRERWNRTPRNLGPGHKGRYGHDAALVVDAVLARLVECNHGDCECESQHPPYSARSGYGTTYTHYRFTEPTSTAAPPPPRGT
jgi:hypothetical protein